MRFRIKQLPRILIVHFKRFSYNGTKLKNPLDFDEEIQIDSEYLALNNIKYSTYQQIEKEYNHVYRLYAIIVHEGYSTAKGHYYAFIKNQDNQLWYKYDDDNVSKVGPNLSSVKKNTNNAYILFYKKFYLENKKSNQSGFMSMPVQQGISGIGRSRSPSFF